MSVDSRSIESTKRPSASVSETAPMPAPVDGPDVKAITLTTASVTGWGDTASKHPDLPKTPQQIATGAIEAAKAGAAIAHIHVREEDGKPSRRLELYKEVVDRVRSSETDVILNLTTGMGGDLDIGQGKNPLEFGPMTDMANIMERIANAEQFLPEICTSFNTVKNAFLHHITHHRNTLH